jgi:hypothetical protein
MRSYKWVSAPQLNSWADMKPAGGLLPRLIRRLVYASVENGALLHINFSADEENFRPGHDGETSTSRPSPKVPAGITYWELSVERKIKQKLDDDYKKRVEGRGAGDFSSVVYIAVTPRRFTSKTKWAADKCAQKLWREVRVYDSDDLEQWLELCPAVACWFSQFAARIPREGLCDLSTRWQNIVHALKKPLPPKLLLISRESAIDRFRKWLSGPPQCLAVTGHSPQEVVDVFTAWVESLPRDEQDQIASRAVIVEKDGSLKEIVDTKDGLILICGEQLEPDENAVSQAVRQGHHVLLPIASVVAAKAGETLRLERINRDDLQKVLLEVGLPEQETYTLAQQSGGSFTVLRRRLSNLPIITTPRWGGSQERIDLAPLLLAGAWQDAKESDQQIIARLSGKPYDYCRSVLSRWRSEPDSPIRWANGNWEFVSPIDAWSFLSPAITSAELKRFADVAVEVLGVDDPRLELPPGERWMGSIKGKEFLYSSELRAGLARTMVLLAVSSDGFEDTVSLQTRVDTIARRILPENSSWKRWASLGHLLPLLAEAAPTIFLDGVEASLAGDHPELAKLFGEESGPITGRAEHTGLLWALERLAWSPEYLPRVATALAKLDEHDPGGQWANRPKASLREIFFSGMPQTAASLEQRLATIRLLQSRHPTAGWRLLTDLLPGERGLVTFHRTPEWRYWAEPWKRGITRQEYGHTISVLMDMAISDAQTHPEKWVDLLPGIFRFSPQDAMRLAVGIEEIARSELSAETRSKLWAGLSDLLERYEYLSDNNWSLAPELIEKLRIAHQKLLPTDPVDFAIPIFQKGFRFVGRKSLTFEGRMQLLREYRVSAIRRVLDGSGFDAVLALARRVEDPRAVGHGLVEVTGPEFELRILPSLLVSTDGPIQEFAKGFAQCRIFSVGGREWAESLPTANWQPKAVATFATLMPFDRRTWECVARFGKEIEEEYWRATQYIPHEMRGLEVEFAAQKLLAAKRPRSAIDLLAMAAHSKCNVSPVAQLEILESAFGLQPEDHEKPIDGYDIQTVLGQIQASPDIDQTRLAKIEWLLLPSFDEHFSKPRTLHNLLAHDPSFFGELLSLVYRAHNSSETQDLLDDETREFKKHHTQRAWHLLREWHTIPGSRDDGAIDAVVLRNWTDTARKIASDSDRIEVCDLTLGELLAYAPEDPDKSWPCTPVRDLLESIDSARLFRGLHTGVMNKRGVYSKSPHEGGAQERDLAAKYEAYSKMCQNRWPKTAAALRGIRDDYLEYAKREDAEAEARE